MSEPRNPAAPIAAEQESVPSRSEIAAMIRLRRSTPIAFALDAVQCLHLIAMLQLSLRHPNVTGSSVKVATAVAWSLRDQLVELEPDIAPMIDRGWEQIPAARKN